MTDVVDVPVADEQQAQQAEATGDLITFEYEGVTYQAPPTLQWPAKTFRMLGVPHMAADLLLAVLGPEVYLPFENDPKHTNQSVLELSAAMEKAQGLAQGEASASAAS